MSRTAGKRQPGTLDVAVVAHFVHLLLEEDSARATHCQGLLRKLGIAESGLSA